MEIAVGMEDNDKVEEGEDEEEGIVHVSFLGLKTAIKEHVLLRLWRCRHEDLCLRVVHMPTVAVRKKGAHAQNSHRSRITSGVGQLVCAGAIKL